MDNNSNNLSIASRSSNSLFEYLLVGHPDAEVHAKVMEEKRLFTKDFGEKIAAFSEETKKRILEIVAS